MYRVPLRASAAITSGVALVSLFGALSPAMAKGSDRTPEAPPAVAFECVEPATTPVSAPDAPVAAPDAPVAAPDAPVAAPDAPVAAPDAPATAPVAAPDTAPIAADTSVAAPDAPATVPDTPATAPETPVAAPDLAINHVGDAGCVAVLVTPGTVRLAWVVPAPGWTFEVRRNGGGTNDRVELRFTQTATNANLDFRFERGKTSIG